MGRVTALTREYGSLGLLLLLVASTSATMIVSCGGGGGGSDGSLCSQCGLSPDGPCQETVPVAPEDRDANVLCEGSAPCNVDLICRRKVDSAQQRCFALLKNGNVNFQFECDGSRPGGTAVPEATLTPTPSATVTVSGGATASPTATPAATATVLTSCGDGVVDADEECDGSNLDEMTCDDLCFDPGGTLACNPDCTFNVSGCTSPPEDCSCQNCG